MKNNWPETVDELIKECEKLKNRYDLYTLGEKGEPLRGESEPRVDGTRYFAGEYEYGVAMVPAQWVTHVISEATLGRGTCRNVAEPNEHSERQFMCSECGARGPYGEGTYHLASGATLPDGTVVFGDAWPVWKYCPNCGREVVE